MGPPRVSQETDDAQHGRRLPEVCHILAKSEECTLPARPPPARSALLAALAALLPWAAFAGTTLYDPALGTLPSGQGWQPMVVGGAAGQSVGAGVYALDTTGADVAYWGNAWASPLPLDTQTGFDISFSLQLLGETHTSPNRAGYALVVQGAQAMQALELGFWTDHIWAQRYDASQPDRLVHDIDVAFDTRAALTVYTLAVRQQQFTLSAGGNALLSGALRDYTARGWPYTTPNFLFLGDNSSRGDSTSRLGGVSLSPVPEPAAGVLVALGLAGLALRRR